MQFKNIKLVLKFLKIVRCYICPFSISVFFNHDFKFIFFSIATNLAAFRINE